MTASTARMTIVRRKVAKSELTFSTPILAKIAVNAAKAAERSAQKAQGARSVFNEVSVIDDYSAGKRLTQLPAIDDAAFLRRVSLDVVGLLPTPEQLETKIQSALGPIIDGRGALARLAFHPAYHHGQTYQLKSAPGFPR